MGNLIIVDEDAAECAADVCEEQAEWDDHHPATRDAGVGAQLRAVALKLRPKHRGGTAMGILASPAAVARLEAAGQLDLDAELSGVLIVTSDRLDAIEQKLAVIASCVVNSGKQCCKREPVDVPPPEGESYQMYELCEHPWPCPKHQPDEFARLTEIAMQVKP